MIDAAIELTLGLAEGLIEALPMLIEKLPEIVIKIVSALVKEAPRLVSAGIELALELLKGILSLPGQIKEAGKNLIKGLWEGIKSFDIVGYVKNLANDILGSFKKVLGIHSPSKEFAYLGKMSMLGYTESIEDMKDVLTDSIESTFSFNPNVSSAGLHYSPNVIVNNNITANTDSLGQTVTNIKTFANGSKNDYNYGMGV